jgi:hypothetical protein
LKLFFFSTRDPSGGGLNLFFHLIKYPIDMIALVTAIMEISIFTTLDAQTRIKSKNKLKAW